MLPLVSNIFQLFSSNVAGTCVVTLCLIALFFVAWKAPAWVKEAGLAGLAIGWLWTLIEFMQMGNAIAACGPDADAYVIWGAVPCALLPAAYGTVVYIISLIIRVVRKPKM